MYVRPESRRAGVATALVLHALRFVAPLQVRDEREKRGEQRERAREDERSRDTDREGHKQRETEIETQRGAVLCVVARYLYYSQYKYN